MGQVQAICLSKKKGVQKRGVGSAVFLSDHGIEDDAHAGSWHRQVSLLSTEDIDTIRQEKLPDIKPGAFAENIVLSGVDLGKLGLGSRIQLGQEVVLSISQIGKVCHSPCAIGRLTGDCIMPRLGLFGRVITAGNVKVGDEAKILEMVSRDLYQAVILTISDSCSQGKARDTAGPAVGELLADQLKAHIYGTEILPDEQVLISERLKHYCNGHSIDLIVTVGGTGFSPRDVTPEASRRVIQRFTPGLDEAMRAASLAKTAHAMLSRGVSGINGSTLIINLPGSKRAATENLKAIVEPLNHGLLKLRGDSEPCAPIPAVREQGC